MPLGAETFDVQVRFGLDNASFLGQLNSMGRSLQTLGNQLTMGISLPLAGMATAAINASLKFNTAMANIASLIPGNTARIQELKTGVQDLSVEFGKSTAEMSAGLYEYIGAFGDTADTMANLENAARLAVAGAATVQEAILATTAVTKAYGDSSAEATAHVADLIQMTVNLGQTTMPQLTASIV
jgi:TP901 family phage tail tape measure protein